MAFNKITDEDRAGKGNVGQPDTPGLTTAEMQEQMDSLANLAIDRFNAHLDELAANTAAAYIGATVPTGITANENIQSILNVISGLITALNNVKHSHANKTELDAINATVKAGYDAVVLLLDEITAVNTSVSNSDAEIPTCKAVKTYADNLNVNAKAINAVYPVGAVYSARSNISPGSTLGYGVWSQVGDADSEGVYRFVRTS
jgi:hypothetical protein